MRTRRLSEEDRAFWHAWAAHTQVVPLKGREPLPQPPVAGACVVGVWVRGDEGTLWRASGGGRDGLTAGLC